MPRYKLEESIKLLVKEFPVTKYIVTHVKNKLGNREVKTTITNKGKVLLSVTPIPKNYYNFKKLKVMDRDFLVNRLELPEDTTLTELDITLKLYLELGYEFFAIPCTSRNIVLFKEEEVNVVLLSIYL